MNKELVILGAGESGTGAALLAKAKGHEVFVSDNKPIRENYKKELSQAGVTFEEGRHSLERVLNAREVVKSPGIPDSADLIKKIKSKGISVISEIEFAGRYMDAQIIGVTGSNGKTTTAMWTTHILKRGGQKVVLAGNIGQSFARELLKPHPDFFVLELSSFQLDGMFQFKCDTSVLTNITPDHLDRYGFEFNNYIDAKFRILQNQTSRDIFIYCSDNEVVVNKLKTFDSQVVKCPFSYNRSDTAGAYVENEQLIFQTGEQKVAMPLNALALPGRHNLYNAMAAGLASLRAGVSAHDVIEGLTHFAGVEHRMEQVMEVDQVLFINDSKATNVDSTWYALQSMTRRVIWIAGGTDKGNDYSALAPLVREKVKALIWLGVDNRKLISSFGEMVPQIVEARSMEEAIQRARRLSVPGDVVLLSPACASFDLFNNYEHRGQLFKKEVKNLIKTER